MHVQLVPSAVGTAREDPDQFLTSYLINGTVAVDAGSIGFYRDARDQARIKHLFVSHTHIDHIASLPIFVENAYEGGPDPVTIYGSAAVLDCLRRDLFNGRLWPDFVAMSSERTPFLRLQELEPGRAVVAGGLRVLPVAVDHIVPTLGFLVEEGGRTVAIGSDTGPTEALWEAANAAADLRAVFLEVTFPDGLAWLAEASMHLTPSLFAAELRKLRREADVLAVHIKARYRRQVEQELAALDLPRVRVGRFGVDYEF